MNGSMRIGALPLVSVCVVACASPRYVPQGSHRDFDRGEKILYARRAAELQECVPTDAPSSESEVACTARVRASWKPIEQYLSEMHKVWCDAKPGDCPTGGKLPEVEEAAPPTKTQPKAAPTSAPVERK